MKKRPEITVSSLDVYRLYNIVDALPANSFPGKEELLSELTRAQIVAPADIPPTVVTMNSTIRFRIAALKKKRELEQTLVYPADDDASGTRISILTPVGSALLGLSQGDEIEWPTEEGLMKIKVLEIVYQPERAGDFQR